MKNMEKKLFQKNKNLIAPFMGNLGLPHLPNSLSNALQNHQLHFRAIAQVYRIFQPDFIFPLMNVSLEAIALGKSADFSEHAPPRVKSEILETTAIFSDQSTFWQNKLLQNYLQTLKMLARELPKQVVKSAYLTGPFTLTCLLNGFRRTHAQLKTDPARIRRYLRACSQLNLQLAAEISALEIDAIVLLEPVASLMQPDEFNKFLLANLSSIAAEYKLMQLDSILHICGNSTALFDQLPHSNFQAISLDSAAAGVDLTAAAERLDPKQYIWGNLDPLGTIYQGNARAVWQAGIQKRKQMQRFPKFVLGTGCDLPATTPPENVHALLSLSQ
jgi:uroporphyrinogen-III decarboxylase